MTGILRSGLTFATLTTMVIAVPPNARAAQLPEPVREASQIPFTTSDFTFVRVLYDSGEARNAWATDFPEADLHFTMRVGELTGLAVSPDEFFSIPLTDPSLSQYPFLYMVEGGKARLTEEEVVALRNYLLGGGFLMVDDFWGVDELQSLAGELRRVFPGQELVELGTDHEIFRSFYEFDEVRKVPDVGTARQEDPLAIEALDQPYYLGLSDDSGRLMAILCYNSDFGDAWEFADSPGYPAGISQGFAIPMGINIVVYALTH
jgi:Domain of unknown function (DUF4159)